MLNGMREGAFGNCDPRDQVKMVEGSERSSNPKQAGRVHVVATRKKVVGDTGIEPVTPRV